MCVCVCRYISVKLMHTRYKKYNQPSTVKGKFHPIIVMKAQRRITAIAILFL